MQVPEINDISKLSTVFLQCSASPHASVRTASPLVSIPIPITWTVPGPIHPDFVRGCRSGTASRFHPSFFGFPPLLHTDPLKSLKRVKALSMRQAHHIYTSLHGESP
jgi:hypothetical protein